MEEDEYCEDRSKPETRGDDSPAGDIDSEQTSNHGTAATLKIDLSERAEERGEQPARTEPGGETLAIDLSELLERDAGAHRPGAGESGGRDRGFGPRDPASTTSIDLEEAGGGSELRPDDRGDVQPFPFGRLEQITDRQRRGLDALVAALPADDGRRQWADALEDRLEQLLETRHRVEWTGIGTILVSGRSFEIERGIWTWGRMPPRQCRFVVGVGRRLADGWARLAGPDDRIWGDDFEFGLVTFLIAQCCAVVTERAGWPPLAWAVNPMNRRDLRTMLVAEATVLVEITFEIESPEGRGPLRLWLPLGLVRDLPERSRGEVDTEADPGACWWSELTTEHPLVAGVTRLRPAEINRLNVGDVVLVTRHGVDVGEIGSSARPTGAHWQWAADRAVVGRLIEGPDEGWRLQIEGTRLETDEETGVVDSESDEQREEADQEALSVPVEEADVEVEVRIGAVEMRLSQLARLQRGQVIDCEIPLGSPVDLVAGTTRIGRGELVNVDGNLGVRILSTNTD